MKRLNNRFAIEMTSNFSSKLSTQTQDGGRDPSARLYFLYHEISPSPAGYTYALDKASFREHLEVFARARAYDTGWLWPEVTFDDGHVSNLDCALPLLSEFRIAAHFFITVGWTSQRPNYLTWAQIRELQDAGQRIGAHGWSHTLLTHCPDDQLDLELRSARERLEDELGTPITTMSLPGGRMNRRVLEACRRAGYQQVFTSIPRAEISASAALLGRINLRTDATAEWLEAVLRPGSSLLPRMARTHHLKEFAQRALGDGLYGKLWAILNRATSDAHDA